MPTPAPEVIPNEPPAQNLTPTKPDLSGLDEQRLKEYESRASLYSPEELQRLVNNLMAKQAHEAMRAAQPPVQRPPIREIKPDYIPSDTPEELEKRIGSRAKADRSEATARIYSDWAEQRFRGEGPDVDIAPVWVDAQVEKLMSDRLAYPMRAGMPYYTKQESGDIENVDAAELWKAGEYGEALKEPFRPQLKRPDRDRTEGVGAGVGAQSQFEIDQGIYGDLAEKYGISIPGAGAGAERVAAQREMYEDFTYYGYARDPAGVEEWHKKYAPKVIEEANEIFKGALRAPAISSGEAVANAKKARNDFMLQQQPKMVERQEEARRDFDFIQEKRHAEFIDDLTRVATNESEEILLEKGFGRTLAHDQPDSEVLAAWAKQMGIDYTQKWIETNLPRLSQDAKRRNRAERERVSKEYQDWRDSQRGHQPPSGEPPWSLGSEPPKEYLALGRATRAGVVEGPLEAKIMGAAGVVSRGLLELSIMAPFTWDVHPDGTPVNPDDLTLKQHEASVRIIKDYNQKYFDPEYWENTTKYQQVEDRLQAFAATYRPGGLPVSRTEGPTGMPGIVSQHNGVTGIANSVMMNVLSGIEKRRWAPDDIDAIEGLGTVAKTAAVMFELGIPISPWAGVGFAMEAPRGIAKATAQAGDAVFDFLDAPLRGKFVDGVNVLYPHPDNVAKAFGETPVSLKMTTGDGYQNAIEFLSSPIAFWSVKTSTAGKASMARSFAKGAAAREITTRGWKYKGLPEVVEAMDNLNVGMMGARSLVRAITANFQGEDLIRYLEDASERAPNVSMKEGLDKAVLDLKANPEMMLPENALKAEDTITFEFYNSMLRAYGDTVFANDGMDVIMKASTKQLVKRPAEAKTRTIAEVKGTSKVNIRDEINNAPFTIDDFDKTVFDGQTHAWRMSLDMGKLRELYSYEINGVRYERPPPAAVKRDIAQINTHGLATTAMQHRVFNWIEAAEMQRLAIRDFDDGVAKMVTASDIARFEVPSGPPLSTPVEAWGSLRPSRAKSAIEAIPGALDKFMETDVPYFGRAVSAAKKIDFPRFIGGGPGRRIPLYTLGRNLGISAVGHVWKGKPVERGIKYIPKEFKGLKKILEMSPEKFVNPNLLRLIKEYEQSVYNINSEFRNLLVESQRDTDDKQRAFLNVIDEIVLKSVNDPMMGGSPRRFYESTLGYFLDVKGRQTSATAELYGKEAPVKKTAKRVGEGLTADDLVKSMDAYASLKGGKPFDSVYNLATVLPEFLEELRTAVRTKKGSFYNKLKRTLGTVPEWTLGSLQTRLLQSAVDAAQGMNRDHFFAAIEVAAKNEMAQQKYNQMVRDILDQHPDMVRKIDRLPDEERFALPSHVTGFETHEEMYRIYLSAPIRRMIQEQFGDDPKMIAETVLGHFFQEGDISAVGAQRSLRKRLEENPEFVEAFDRMQKLAKELHPGTIINEPVKPIGYDEWKIAEPLDAPSRPVMPEGAKAVRDARAATEAATEAASDKIIKEMYKFKDPTKEQRDFHRQKFRGLARDVGPRGYTDAQLAEWDAWIISRNAHDEELVYWSKAKKGREDAVAYDKAMEEWRLKTGITGEEEVTPEILEEWRKWDGDIENPPKGITPDAYAGTLQQWRNHLKDEKIREITGPRTQVVDPQEVYKESPLARLIREKLNKGVESVVQRRINKVIKEYKEFIKEDIIETVLIDSIVDAELRERGIIRDPEAPDSLVTAYDRERIKLVDELSYNYKGKKRLDDAYNEWFQDYLNAPAMRADMKVEADKIWSEEISKKMEDISSEVHDEGFILEQGIDSTRTVAILEPVYEAKIAPKGWGASEEMQRRVREHLAAAEPVPSGFRIKYMKDGVIKTEIRTQTEAAKNAFLEVWKGIEIPGSSMAQRMGAVPEKTLMVSHRTEGDKVIWEQIEEGVDPRYSTHSAIMVMGKDFDENAVFGLPNEAIIAEGVFALKNPKAAWKRLSEDPERMDLIINQVLDDAIFRLTNNTATDLLESVQKMGFSVGVSDAAPRYADLMPALQTLKDGIYLMGDPKVNDLIKQIRTKAIEGKLVKGLEALRPTDALGGAMLTELGGVAMAGRRTIASGLMGMSPRYQGTNVSTWPLIQLVTNPSMVLRTMYGWATHPEALIALVREFPKGTGVGRALQKGLDRVVNIAKGGPQSVQDSWAISFERAWDKYMFGYDTDAVFTAPNGKTYTAKDLDDLMDKKGVFESFVKFEFSDQDIQDTQRVAGLDKDLSQRGLVKQIWSELDPRNKNVFNRAAQAMDNSYRRAAFIAALSMGMDETSAGIVAKTSNLDYSRTTDFERKTIAKWRLFYSFQRNMLVETLEAFLRADFSAQAMLKWYRNQESLKRAMGTYATQPDYGESRAFVVPHKLSGTQAIDFGAAGWAGPGVPFLDSIKSINTIASHLHSLVFDTKDYLVSTSPDSFGAAGHALAEFLIALPEADLMRHLMESVDDGSKYGAYLNPKLVLRAKKLGDWDTWVKKYGLVRTQRPIAAQPEFYDEFTGEMEQYRFGSPEFESDFKWSTYWALVANFERVPNEIAVFHTLWTGEIPKGAKLKRFEKNRWMAVLYLAGLATPINLTNKQQEHLMLLKTLEKGISEETGTP
tara:strand:- start:3319 stop:11088 length:7770 start_codon:yes stop_codon:yes gene_type:complete